MIFTIVTIMIIGIAISNGGGGSVVPAVCGYLYVCMYICYMYMNMGMSMCVYVFICVYIVSGREVFMLVIFYSSP